MLATHALERTDHPTEIRFDRGARPAKATVDHALAAFDIGGTRLTFARNAEICGQGEDADLIYVVETGVIRTCTLLADGRRQLGAFLFPGEIFGIEIDDQGRRCWSAEAVTDCRVSAMRRGIVEKLAQRECAMATSLWAHAARDVGRLGARLALLGRKSAEERVAAFMGEMAERGGDSYNVELPMSRQDVADYLGLTVETVSRTLAQLESEGAIRLRTARRIEITNPEELAALGG